MAEDVVSALHEIDEGLMGVEKELKDINTHLEEHTKTDEHYRSMLEKMYAAHKKNNNKNEENEMHVEVPAIVAGSNDNTAAIVAAMAAGNRGYGNGFGGDGLLAAALLSGGLFGNRNHGDWGRGEGCVTPAQLTAGLTGVTDAIQNTTIADGIGDIKQGVFQAEGNLQLAIAVAQSELAGQINSASLANLGGQAVINKNISDAIASSLASQNNINVNVLQTAAAGISATKDAQYALAAAIKDDGEKTRALITSNTITELQRELSVAQIAALEDRLHTRSREVEVNVTQNVNQQQLQVQAQQQQQQQLALLGQLCAHISGLQNAVSTNSNLIVGNTGAVATGPQSSSPVNVRA